jgi:hypothetical protein
VDELVDEEAGLGGGGAVALIVLVDELLEVGEVLGGEETALPATEVGPVDFWELRRLASI